MSIYLQFNTVYIVYNCWHIFPIKFYELILHKHNIVHIVYLQIKMFKSLKLNSLKNTIGINNRSLWKWIDDTFNRQVFIRLPTI